MLRARWRRILGVATVALLAIVLIRAWDLSRQLPAGDGWQLLAQQRAVGDRNGIHLIEDQAALDAAWTRLQLRSDPVTVDFGRSVVAWLTPQGTIACPTRLDEIRFDRARSAVDGAFSFGLSTGCGSPPVNDSFLVAMDRDRLPSPSFELRMIGPEPADVTTRRLVVQGYEPRPERLPAGPTGAAAGCGGRAQLTRRRSSPRLSRTSRSPRPSSPTSRTSRR